MIFEIFGGFLYPRFDIIQRIKSIWNDLMSEVNFSLEFHAKKLKNIKIAFLTKRGQNRKSI